MASVCQKCGKPLTKKLARLCQTCWRNRGPETAAPRTYQAKVCGHPTSRPENKYCRKCYDQRRGSIVEHADQSPVSGASTFSAHGDTAEVARSTPEHVRTLADLVRVCEIDTDEWIVERWVANKWEMGSKAPDGSVSTTPLYQVKAWLKRNRPLIEAKAEIAALIAEAKKQIAPRKAAPQAKAGPYMLELAIPDLHLGKLAWSPETGGPNYDSKIAAELFTTALDALIARTSGFSFERVILPVGNDFYHADTKQGTTTKGTPLDTDSRYHKTFVVGRKLIADAIERLRTLAPVEVLIVPGNHDTMGAFHLGDSLECLYHNTPDVTVRNEPIQRKYVSYGRNLVMFTHGQTGKKQNYPLLMATERPDLFGAARFREAHVGHTHELKIQEHMGVRVRVSPALCPADAWHSENHFVGNLRSAEALVWSRDEGLVATATYTVIEDVERAS